MYALKFIKNKNEVPMYALKILQKINNKSVCILALS